MSCDLIVKLLFSVAEPAQMGLQMIFATIILTGLLYYFFAPGLIMLRTPSYLPYAILSFYAQTASIPAEARLGDPTENRTPVSSVRGSRPRPLDDETI